MNERPRQKQKKQRARRTHTRPHLRCTGRDSLTGSLDTPRCCCTSNTGAPDKPRREHRPRDTEKMRAFNEICSLNRLSQHLSVDRGRLALEGAHLAQLKLHPTSPPPAPATTYHKLQQSHCWVRTQQTRNQLLREISALTSLQHYPQQPRCGNKPSVHGWKNGYRRLKICSKKNAT